jgi:SAM-dependent methyltransferase
MTDPSVVSEQQLRRQVEWLKRSWIWLLRTKVLGSEKEGRRLEALDVGCGPGLVMEELDSIFDVQGLDRDGSMVEICHQKGLTVVQGEAEVMPFENNSFDAVYCSFLLLWVKEPQKVIKEMKRVSRRWVVCLAEPDLGGRIDHPSSLVGLKDLLIEGMVRQGADPMLGRKLTELFRTAGLDPEVGAHPGGWGIGSMEDGYQEWRNLSQMMDLDEDDRRVTELERAWKEAAANGTLFQYNPIFYAIARK